MALEVAAAVIQRPDGAFLLARRPAGKVYAGYWEFPGGKIEPGEPAELALARELREELGIEPASAYPWLTREYVYPHAAVRLHFFRVTSWRGAPHPHEGQEIAWQRHGESLVAPMLPANAPVLAALALPHEYAVTDATRLGVAPMLEKIQQRLAEGLRLIQVRDRGLAGRDAFVQDVVELARPYGAKVLVSGGHPLGHGAHYTAAQLGTLGKRPDAGLAAASCHDAAELAHAAARGLDFAVLGPVKPTATHPDLAPMGWKRFAELVRGAAIPVFAIGGLLPSDLESAWRAGAHGVAMVRGSWGGMRNVV